MITIILTVIKAITRQTYMRDVVDYLVVNLDREIDNSLGRNPGETGPRK